jgi:hypothetical protein
MYCSAMGLDAKEEEERKAYDRTEPNRTPQSSGAISESDNSEEIEANESGRSPVTNRTIYLNDFTPLWIRHPLPFKCSSR